MAQVTALVFDIYGTVVDWRSAVVAAVEAAARAKGVTVDGAAFADDWKAAYRPAMAEVNEGRRPWTNVDAILRGRLDEIVGQYGLDGLTEEEREALNDVWSRARPWPDAVPALTRLRANFLLCTLSNCTFAWLVALAKGQGLPFDAILASENARAYKPAPEVYEMTIELLGGRAEELLLVACHNYDLEAARAHGMQTAFLPRKEDGPGQTADQEPTDDWDYVVPDLEGLADKLGC